MVRQQVADFSRMPMQGDAFQLLEKRMENDGSGNPLYVGYARTPNASTTALEWFIVKMSYDGGGFVSRVQLPDTGAQFKYAWDSRANYFA